MSRATTNSWWETSVPKSKKQNKNTIKHDFPPSCLIKQRTALFKMGFFFPLKEFLSVKEKSHKQSLNGHLNRLDLWLELRPLFYSDWGSDNGARHPTGPAQGLLGADEHVGDVLVLAEQRQVEDDLQWFRISSHHDKLSDASVQGFSGWGRKSNLNTASLFLETKKQNNAQHITGYTRKSALHYCCTVILFVAHNKNTSVCLTHFSQALSNSYNKSTQHWLIISLHRKTQLRCNLTIICVNNTKSYFSSRRHSIHAEIRGLWLKLVV